RAFDRPAGLRRRSAGAGGGTRPSGSVPRTIRDMKPDTMRRAAARLYSPPGGRTMLRPSVVFPLLLLVGCGTAVADHNRYKWRDAQGNLHYSDSLPAEAARMGYEVVNSHGIVIKRV